MLSVNHRSAETLLEVDDLRTYFFTRRGVVRAVDGVSFRVAQGETAALVGESGCGKSVSALSVMGLIPVPPGKIVGGQVRFQGIDLTRLPESDLRHVRGKEIAMVFQEPMSSLNPVLTIGDQLTEGMKWHLRLSQKDANETAKSLLDQVGISDPVRRLRQYPHELSGGMRQRVMIAIALSCRPKMIIADEATTALDVTIQAQILDLMKRLTSESNVTLLIITHNLGIVARYADRIYILYSGRVIEEGTSREIFKDPRHPYTRGLLRSVPRLDSERRTRLNTIEGQPPNLTAPMVGCSFAPRCPHADERCRCDLPPVQVIEGQHRASCWIAGELEGRKSW